MINDFLKLMKVFANKPNNRNRKSIYSIKLRKPCSNEQSISHGNKLNVQGNSSEINQPTASTTRKTESINKRLVNMVVVGDKIEQ